MSKTLVIVESPAKCKKIETYLGGDYKVIASYGHFTKLNSLDQINFDTYDIKYKVDNQKVLKQIKTEIKKCKEVIIATDDDREGEAIGWALCIFCKLDLGSTKKITFQEITKEAIAQAMMNITHINMDKVRSQQCRQILDIYLGYKISPMLWRNIQHKLSAGRCQTPALKLIYDNEEDIKGQDTDTHYNINSTFTSKNIKFQGEYAIDKSSIESFIEEQKNKEEWKINTYKKSSTTLQPPAVLITSTLQQKASTNLRFSPKMTMSYAQELYENGLITYMRTDSAIYSKDFIGKLKNHIENNYGEKYLRDNIYEKLTKNTNKNKAQEAHEGIRVCDLSILTSNTKTPNANKLYQFIYKHSIQCGMSNALIDNHRYDIFTKNNEKIYKLYTVCKEYVFNGWKILDNDILDGTMIHKMYMENLYNSETPITLQHMICLEEMKNKKLHFTESGLIQKLESLGIGRPSTYSNIIQSLYQKKYVEKKNISGLEKECITIILDKNGNINRKKEVKQMNSEKGKIKITQIGIEVCKYCYEHFNNLFEYEFTKNMEVNLDEISVGNRKIGDILNSYTKDVNEMVENSMIFLKENPDSIIKKKVQTSLHCGNYKGHPCYIKTGPYGYYVNILKNEKISLKDFEGFDISEKINGQEISISENDRLLLLKYIEDSKNKKNENVLLIVNEDISIRKSKFGNYVYYKTNKMKKPKFLKYNDEKDEYIDKRNKWIIDMDVNNVKKYLMKKYNISI